MAVDKEMSITYMNLAGANVLGKKQKELKGLKCYDQFKTGHCNTENCQTARAIKEDGVFTLDTVANLPGCKLPIRYSGCSLKDAQGKIIGGLEFVVDISGETAITQGVTRLVEAAVDGRLDERADTSKFDGNYEKIISGVNELLEAIVKPLNETANVLETASKKDLRKRISGEYKGMFAELKGNVNNMMDALDEALGQVAEAVSQVTSASNQISSGSQNLAAGANEQAGSIEEMSSSIEEITSMTRQNALNSTEANKLSQEARNSGVKGNDGYGEDEKSN